MKVPSTHRGAFTLVEVLIAIAILTVMLLFLGTVVASVNTVSTGASQNAENTSNARAILDLLCRELAAGVSRPDLNQGNWITVSNSPATVNFFSQSTGSAVTTMTGTTNPYRPLSYIEYKLVVSATSSYLARGDQAVLWTDTPANRIPLGVATPTLPTTTDTDVLDGVVAFKVTFLQQDGSLSDTYSSTNTTAAIVSLALADSRALKILTKTGQLQTLSNMLIASMATSPTGVVSDPKFDWESAVNTGAGISTYPQKVKTGLRFFERTVDLPKPIL